MVVSIRRLLWSAFAALVVLVVVGLTVNVLVLNAERREEFAVMRAEPLLDDVQRMDDAIDTMVGASRAYMLTHDPRFEQQYDDAVSEFTKQYDTAKDQATDNDDRLSVSQFKAFFENIRALTKRQIQNTKLGVETRNEIIETARARHDAPDFAGLITERHRREQTRAQEELTSLRQSLTRGYGHKFLLATASLAVHVALSRL